MNIWKAIARSAQSFAHRQMGQPCQDYARYAILPNETLIGAVAGGSDSASCSYLGAVLAAESSLRTLEEYLYQNHGQFPVSQEGARQLFIRLYHDALIQIEKIARIHQCKVENFTCTLMVFVATPQGMLAMQIGNGLLVVRQAHGMYQLLFRPVQKQLAHPAIFVTSGNALEAMQVCVLQVSPVFLCAATDGLEPVALRLQDWAPYASFFRPLEDYLTVTPDPERSPEYLEQFLVSDWLSQWTTNDRTMLLAQRRSVDGHYRQFSVPESPPGDHLNGGYRQQS